MRPRDPGLDKFLQIERRRDRPGMRPVRYVVDVCRLAVEELAVGAPQRQAPHRVVLRRARRGQPFGELVVIAEQCRQFRPERDPRRARQGRGIDEHRRLFRARLGERIAQDQAPLGIGVADLDRDALPCLDDVERPHRVAADRVLDERQQHAQSHRHSALHDRLRQAEHDRGAAHVLLHHLHAGGGFEVEPARVEAHALPDQCHLWRVLVAPANIDETRLAAAGAPDRMDRRIILGEQRITRDHAVLRAGILGHRDRRLGEFRGPEIGGRRVDQIARETHRIREPLGEAAVRALGPYQPRPVFLLFVAVQGEGIGAERPAQG